MKEKLFTNQNQQKLLVELNHEMQTADEVCFVFPFISKAIINKIEASIKHCCANKIPIRIITTTFDDLAEYNNLLELARLVTTYDNIQIKVEDNLEKRSERIHIKASVFKRFNGVSTAIIGSSNLTYKGMITGREWNIKLTTINNHSLVTEIITEFEQLWNEVLVDFNDEFARNHLLERINQNQTARIATLFNNAPTEFLTIRKYLYDFQKDIVAKLQYRRKLGKNAHLVIMATGTGKTVVAAFDYFYQLQAKGGQLVKILFLAHQKEILDQALQTFRGVLMDQTFGEVMYEGKTSENNAHLFATIQTMANKLSQFKRDHFDVIIFDEAHHIAATTFDQVFNYFQPQQVLGLTATPEREDGKSIKKYFADEYAAELRLWDAINQRLLCPFDYYCIDDNTVDLTGVDLNADNELFKKLNTTARNDLLLKMIDKYIGLYAKPTALIFCVTTEHAKLVATFLRANHLRADYLTSENREQRTRILHEFKIGRINYLCVVNMFNEGIDVPEINTIILLRPTNSKTVYLQQLGRGLRKTELKSRLEVYDLISNIDSKYDITIGIKNLYDPKLTSIKGLLANEGLPYNCTITLEQRSQKVILNNLRKWYDNRARIKSHIREYYQKYQNNGLAYLLHDYDLSLYQFYNYVNDFYVKIGRNIERYQIDENNTNRNKNLLKQFLFLDSYQLINYFILRLSQKLTNEEINLDYDNLLITSLLYEVTSMTVFIELFPNYATIPDLVTYFINHHQLIVTELLIILQYKLEHETLKMHSEQKGPLLKGITYTVKQVLSVIGRTNFLLTRGELRIIAFQAGYLTFDKVKQVILADEDGTGYGKLTKYLPDEQVFYWSIPETMTLANKLVKDIQNNDIVKYLFLQNKINTKWSNLGLKLYCFIGFGHYETMLTENYLTAKFSIEKD
ncbi:DEAD/DEAH family helicase [Spiroplasma sp. NBRC 100390]|uniref:DEAD/DEAH box helicase family protein n=1 Tax=unclassified Spiroplasma TaxID=2637901 RepID=UPI0008928581|nr:MULTISPECIES: DEAD/DEAH box helicase family protein [unclassified Spiroplasma]AOX43944.1 DEAD/DEAH family helicase [Spiroplasma sp. TU-14]APE13414.1 DEAD/DEAH family helicase [Spiroplasma sp. NBRC 100390]